VVTRFRFVSLATIHVLKVADDCSKQTCRVNEQIVITRSILKLKFKQKGLYFYLSDPTLNIGILKLTYTDFREKKGKKKTLRQ